MNRSESIGKLAGALAKAQAAMEGASKDSRNPHFNSKYADLASIVDACRKPLADQELSYVQNAGRPEAGLVSMTTMILHASGEWIESDPLVVQAKDAGPQAVGSCLTYLRRYQLAAMVGIAPEDDDAEAAEGRTVPSQQTARPAAPRPPTPQQAPRMNPPNTVPKPNGGTHGQLLTREQHAAKHQPVAAGVPLTDDDIPF